MRWARTDTLITAALCAAWAVVLVRHATVVGGEDETAAAQSAWRELSERERVELVRVQQSLHRRTDAREILAHAREFAALGVAEQDELRALHALMAEARRAAPAASTRWIDGLPPAARAKALLDLIRVRRKAEVAAAPGHGGVVPPYAAFD